MLVEGLGEVEGRIAYSWEWLAVEARLPAMVLSTGTLGSAAGLTGGQAVGRLLGRWGPVQASLGGGWSQPSGLLPAPYSAPTGPFGEAAVTARLGNWLLSGAGNYRPGRWTGGLGVQYRTTPWLAVGAEGFWPGTAGAHLRVSWGRGWSVLASAGAGLVPQAGLPQYQAAVALAYHAQPPAPVPAAPKPLPVEPAPAAPAVVALDDTYEPTGTSAEPDEGLAYLRVTVAITGRRAEESKGRAEQVCKALEVQSGLPVECVLGAITVTPDKTRIELAVERLTSQ